MRSTRVLPAVAASCQPLRRPCPPHRRHHRIGVASRTDITRYRDRFRATADV